MGVPLPSAGKHFQREKGASEKAVGISVLTAHASADTRDRACRVVTSTNSNTAEPAAGPLKPAALNESVRRHCSWGIRQCLRPLLYTASATRQAHRWHACQSVTCMHHTCSRTTLARSTPAVLPRSQQQRQRTEFHHAAPGRTGTCHAHMHSSKCFIP